MAEAHSAGIVHRDLKPANLFLAREGKTRVLKVLDFGISKVNDGNVELTSTYAAMGTPLYMSPEQARSSKSVDERTDVWALSVILYELLTGRPPFFGESATAVIAAIASDNPVPLSELRPDIPRDIEATVRIGMTKDRKGRFASVGELSAALQGLAATEPGGPSNAPAVSVPTASVSNGLPGSAPATDASWSSHLTGSGRKRISRGVWLGAAVVGGAVVVGSTVMAVGGLGGTKGDAGTTGPVVASAAGSKMVAIDVVLPPASATASSASSAAPAPSGSSAAAPPRTKGAGTAPSRQAPRAPPAAVPAPPEPSPPPAQTPATPMKRGGGPMEKEL
jgi:serine/threonine-protein kinase